MKTSTIRIAVALAACVVATACGGGGGEDDGDAAATTVVRVEEHASEEATVEAVPEGQAPGSTAPPDAAAPPSDVAAPAAPAGGETPATTVAAKPAAVGARPGRYLYRVSGTASGGTPPTTQRHEGTATLTVDPPSGADQRSDHRSGEGNSEQGTETVLRHADDGAVLLVSLVLRGQLAKEFRPAQPVLAMKAAPAAGDRWTWDMRSTDDSTTIHNESEVLGREQVRIGDRTVDCIKVRHQIRITTSFNGAPITVDIDRTGWESPEARLSVKTHTITDVPGFVHDESTATLESLDPA